MTPEPPEIVPGRSACGIELGKNRPDVVAMLGLPVHTRGAEPGGLFEYARGLTVSFVDDAVNMVVFEPGSDVVTADGVRVGTAYRRLVELVGPVVFGEAEHLWRSLDEDGLWYDIARPAKPNEQPLDPPLVPEYYEITRPDTSMVRRIFVMQPIPPDELD